MPCLPRVEQVVAEQRADLVAAQHPPPVGVGHGRGAPVGVGVVGDDQVDVALGGQRHREVHRARLLGVGEGDRREVGVRVLLLAHHGRRVEARGLEDLEDRGAADAVQRRVDQAQVAGAVGGQAGDGVEVAVDDVLGEDLAGVAARDVGQRADGRDPGGDLDVGRRHDLAAVAEVDLVAVVLRRVVAGRHHHPGDAAQLADREGQQRRRQRPRQHQRAQPGAGHHLGGVAGEDVGVVAGVVADDDGGFAGSAVVLQVRRQPGRGAGDDDAVHPVGAGAQRTPEARRAELQRAVEAVLEVVGGAGRDERLEPAWVFGSGSSAAQARARASTVQVSQAGG